MNFCQEHWDGMRAAVEARGMSHLVARSGVEAAQNVTDEFNGVAGASQWDPLMAMNWAIGSRVMRAVGLSLLQNAECPLCVVERSGVQQNGQPGAAEFWTNGCADAMLEHARSLKLVPEVQ